MNPPAASGRRASTVLVCLVVIVAAVLAVFGRTVQGGFLYWDDNILYDNPHIRGLDWERIRWMFTDTQYVWRYVPLSWLGWAATYQFFGADPFAHHLGNLILHAANAILVFLILRRLFLQGDQSAGVTGRETDLSWCCGAGALVWALHPLRVEPVAWVTGRFYDQAAFFMLLSMHCYLKYCAAAGTRTVVLYWFSVAAFAASLLSYQIGLGYVLVLAVLDAYPLRRFGQGKGRWFDARARRLWLEKIPFAVVAALVLVLALLARFHVSGRFPRPVSLAEFGIVERAAQGFFIWAYFLWKPCFPLHLSPYYTTLLSVQPGAPRFILSMILVIGISAVLVVQRRRWPLAGTLWICYLVLLVPVLGLTEHPHQPSDRYSVIVGIAWSVLLTACLLRLGEDTRLRLFSRVGAAIIVVGFGALSYRQTGIWQNSVALHEYMIQRVGDHPRRAWLELRLGRVYLEEGNDQQAETTFNQVLQIDPSSAEAHWHLGNIFYHRGAAEEALRHYSAALNINPNDASTHVNAGAALATLGKIEEAEAQFSEAARLEPHNATAHRSLAHALTKLGRLDEAKVHEEEAQRLENQRRSAPP